MMMKKNKLSSIPGVRIRRQYFNLPMYLMLYTLIVLSVSYVVSAWLAHDENITLYLKRIWNWKLLAGCLIPLIVLSICNRFYFGRIVAVADETGLYTEKDFIPWDCITLVEYDPAIYVRGQENYSGIIFHTNRNETYRRKNRQTFAPRLPLYTLGIIRRYIPHVSRRLSTKGQVMIGLAVGALAVCVVIAYFS